MTPDRWKKVGSVFNSALEREGEERAAYLKQACAGDDSLRLEVESLLAHGKTANGLLDASELGKMAAEIVGKQEGRSLLGTKLGSYQILSLLGMGGMGEVYQAHDSKLRRDVAIKVLPAAFVHDAERLSRFQREARMLASLNHPNIATIHGLEQSNGVHYLVMELVPGQTLAERVSHGPVPIKEALAIAGQIAEALEAAHEKGVIHRDLKPANVKVTQESKVKVLDFGLAKAFAGDREQEFPQDLTVTAMDNEDGRILGTPAYMSPEQARGKPVDKRTDIWAFGCVLYELLTGKAAFQGEDITDTLAAVVRAEPDWNRLPEGIPQSIRTLLRRCLHKDKALRLQAAGDVRIEMQEALAFPASTESATVTASRPRWTKKHLAVSGLALLLGVAIIGVAVWNLKTTASPPRPVTRFTIALPPSEEMLGVDTGHPLLALSPDGTRLLYVRRRNGNTQLYLRQMDQLEFAAIPGTEGAFNPFFSPDSQWIGFFAEGKLKKVSITGGTPQTLCDALNVSGATWGSDDRIIFSGGDLTKLGLYEISAAGGKPVVITAPEGQKGETEHSWPVFLPDGKTVIFCVQRGSGNKEDAQIVAESLDTGQRRVLIEGGTYPQYVPTGHLVYLRSGTMMAAPFDLARLRVTGTPVPIIDGIMYSTPGAAQFSFSNLGSLVYISGNLFGSSPGSLVWVDRKGLAQPIPAPLRSYAFPRLSPDGQKIAMQIVAAKIDIWVYDLTRETLTRLTSEGENTWPIWTRDGRRVTYTSNKDGHGNLFWKPADGSGAEERLTTSERNQSARSWSPDGQLLIFDDRDVSILSLQGDRKPRSFLPGNHETLSQDGRWLAYTSGESGRYEVYVVPFPDLGGRWQISTEGGNEPMWNRNNRELFYWSGNKMMAVDITPQPAFAAGKPRMLFESAAYVRVSDTPNYDVSLDGQRFLMVQATAQQATVQLNVVQNWFEELKRRVPNGK